MNKSIILKIALLLLTTGGLYWFQYSTEKSRVPAHQFFGNIVNQEQEQIWQEFASKDISKEYFNRSYNAHLDKFIKEEQPISQDTVGQHAKNLVHQMLKENGLDPASIAIFGFKDPSPAAATTKFIYINEPLFNELSMAGKRFVLNHEIAHIKQKDNYLIALSETLLNADLDVARKEDKNHLLCKICRFKEKRADIAAATKNDKAADEFLEFITDRIKKVGDTPGTTHPKNSDRLLLAQQIVDYFKWVTPSTIQQT